MLTQKLLLRPLRAGLLRLRPHSAVLDVPLARLRRRLDLSSLEHMLLVPRNQAELRRAYRSAQGYVTALVEQYGREKVLGWVRTGLPHEQLNAVR